MIEGGFLRYTLAAFVFQFPRYESVVPRCHFRADSIFFGHQRSFKSYFIIDPLVLFFTTISERAREYKGASQDKFFFILFSPLWLLL